MSSCLMQAGTITSALAVLAKPPTMPWIERPTFNGVVVARFALPLELCKPQNAKRDAQIWNTQRDRKAIQSQMALQCRPRKEPLHGRPQVLCVRFSSVEPDKYSDWAKMAIDVLCAPSVKQRNRLNLIVDDAPRYADVHQWWEPAPKGKGFVFIEVRTGQEDFVYSQPKRARKVKV